MFDHVREDPLDEERTHLEEPGAAFDAREGQEVLDHPQESLRLVGQTAEQLVARLRVELHRPLQEDLGAAVDRGDGGPQLVREDADEAIAHRVRLLAPRRVRDDREDRRLAVEVEGAQRDLDRDRRPIRAEPGRLDATHLGVGGVEGREPMRSLNRRPISPSDVRAEQLRR